MILSPLEPEDLELLYTIENDMTQWHVTNTNVPYSRYVLRDYIVNQRNDIYADKQIRFVIRIDGRAVGLIDLFNFAPEHLRAEMGLAILQAEQGRGYATQAICLLQDYARNTLHLHQIYCIVPSDNAASLAMLRSTGFDNENTLRHWVRKPDGWQDAIMLQYDCE